MTTTSLWTAPRIPPQERALIGSIKGVENVQHIVTASTGDVHVLLGPGGPAARVAAASVYSGFWSGSYERGEIASTTAGVWLRPNQARSCLLVQRQLDETHPGLHLLGLDGLRLPEAQKSLYDNYLALLRDMTTDNPKWNDALREAYTRQFVSKPIEDFANDVPPMHASGSLDLVLVRLEDRFNEELRWRWPDIDEMTGTSDYKMQYALDRTRFIVAHGHQLEFGTQFDHGGHQAAAGYFETDEGMKLTEDKYERARRNQAYLQWLMNLSWLTDEEVKHLRAERMLPLSTEWWHFIGERTPHGARILGRSTSTLGGVYTLNDEQRALDDKLAGFLGQVHNHSNLPGAERMQPQPASVQLYVGDRP